eukprot:TRINITY_DN6138_c0_g1_i1.p1 TRINITY_DN6138_c0_g1~~TRINITY_DN6138_c0_g1_i1.p1  ORF type:complete len:382 (+),score=117.77 TRINITY_DN6138_c0_g1_i1:72-1148(+)
MAAFTEEGGQGSWAPEAGRFTESAAPAPGAGPSAAVPPRFTEDAADEADGGNAAAVPSSAPDGESAAELEAALDTYRDQERQVRQLLEAEPGNEEVCRIAQDVEDAIRITAAKLEARKQADAALYEQSFVTGAYAEAQFEDGLWYTVRVSDVREPKGPGDRKSWRVLSIGYSNAFEVTLDRLRPWRPPKHIKKGDEIDAVNPSNGLFYSAVVDTVTDRGTVWVTFREKTKVSEEVPLTHIRMARRQHQKRPRVRDEAPPLSDKDREQQKQQRERKRQKQQRFQDRMKEVNEEMEVGRSNWKSFMAAQQGSRGVRSGVAKKSIFASPDDATGRVGVGTCGTAGRGMTKDRVFNPQQVHR